MRKSSLLALLVAAPVATFAGWSHQTRVSIDHANSSASGSLAGARNSADRNEYIGCQLTTGVDGSTFQFCYAHTSARGFVYCWGGGSAISAAIATVSGSSEVTFTWRGGYNGGECTNVVVHNVSHVLN